MAYDPRIILAGQGPDVVNALAGGTRAAAMANAVQRENALADLYRQHGAGIAAGEQNALAMLAQVDPFAVQDIQKGRLSMDSTRQTMDIQRQENTRADKRLDILSAQERRAVEQHAASLSAAEREAEAQKVEQGVRMGLAARTPEEWDAYVGSVAPDLVGQFENRQAIANRFMSVADILKGQKFPGGDNEAERELARLESIGIPRDVGIKIKEGVYRTVTDPTTRETIVIDLSNGAPVWRVDMAGQQQVAPEAAPSAPVTAPQGGNAEDAFGVEGFTKGVANRVGDVTGAGVPFPDVQETQADFGILRESLLNSIADAYDRQPPSWLMQEIRKLTPEAGSLRQGAQGAQSRMRALRRNFQQEVELAEKQLSRRMSPGQREKTEARLEGLRAAVDRVDGALARFGSGETKKTSSGVSWSIEE